MYSKLILLDASALISRLAASTEYNLIKEVTLLLMRNFQ
jgi:hypothetical protein